MTEQEREVMRDVVMRKVGAPLWWADVFLSFGLAAAEAAVFLETAASDVMSPLGRASETRLLDELRGYAEARGYDVSDALGEVAEKKTVASSGRVYSHLRLVCVPEEQTAILREVSGYADVKFSAAIGGVYVSHAVAHGVTQVARSYLFRLVPSGSKVLEVGATMSTIVYAARDPAFYHAAVPMLDVRSGARASVEKQIACVLRNKSGLFTEAQVRTARLLRDDPGQLVTRARVQELDRPADVILSSMANFDIPADDMPVVMERCGARLWLGSLVRVKGINRVCSKLRGVLPIGFRYEADPVTDVIRFSGSKGSEFGYPHSFRGYVAYEERNDYRWRGARYDYVYVKLPATTDNTIFFCVFRVAKRSFEPYSEPRYAPTGKEKLLRVNSFRIARVAGGKPKVVPLECEVERLVFDKAYERRRAMGTKGNIASTMSILRTLRVRMYISGVPVGVEQKLHHELLDVVAMAVELLVGEARRVEERDYAALVVKSHERVSVLSRVMAAVLGGLTSTLFGLKESYEGALRDYMAMLVDTPLVSVVPYEAYVRVQEPVVAKVSSGLVAEPGLPCVAAELVEVARALADASAYTSEEVRVLRAYERELRLRDCGCGKCESESVFFDRLDDALDEPVWYDAESTVACSESSAENSGTKVGSESETSEPVCEVTLEQGPDAVGPEVACIDEYVGVCRYQATAVRAEAKRSASLLFRGGMPPTERELSRASTTRVRHASARVQDGRIVEVVGPEATMAVREVYSVGEKRFHTVDRMARVDTAADGVYYTSSDFVVFNGEQLARSAERLRLSVAVVTDFQQMKFVSGVPGAGKTRDIVALMLSAIAGGEYEVLYVSATSGSADKVRRQVYGSDAKGEEMVRTADSFLLWGFREVHTLPVRLVIDEAPMMHAGQVMACVLAAGLNTADLYGDFQQIPYCSFVAERLFKVERACLRQFSVLTYKTESHRLAVDACAAWVDVYDGGITSCKCCHRERGEETMSLWQVAALAEVPVEKGVRYLTFTQMERTMLLAHLGLGADVRVVRAMESGGLATVHEDQGATHSRVWLVRLVAKYDPKENALAPSIYNRQAYVLTAMTRHVDEFRYYTVSAEEDLVRRRLAVSRCVLRRAVAALRSLWSEVKERVARC